MTVVAPDLDDTIEGFLWVARYERSLAENTIEAYHRDLQALRDYLAAEQGTTRLHGITTEHLRAWMLHLADLEHGGSALVDTGSRRVRAEVQRRWREERAALKALCRRSGVDLLDVPTEGSVADPLVRFFRMRELRGARR